MTMPSSLILLLSAAAGLGGNAVRAAVHADPQISHVSRPTPTAQGSYQLFVTLSGNIPSQDWLTNQSNWHVTARKDGSGPVLATVGTATWNSKTNHVSLEISIAVEQPIDYTWRVLFTGGNWNLVGESDDAPGGSVRPAKGKDDADLYLSGSLSAGRGTAPVYPLDVKLGRSKEVQAWDFGATFSASVNSDAKPRSGGSGAARLCRFRAGGRGNTRTGV